MTLIPCKIHPLELTDISPAARIVGQVVEGTPAAEAGLKERWLILDVDGAPARTDELNAAFLNEGSVARFIDPNSGDTFKTTEGVPLGFTVMPVFNKDYGEDIRAHASEPTDFLQAWALGHDDLYALLQRDFEAALSPLQHTVFGGFVTEKRKMHARLESHRRWEQVGLALAYLAVGELEKAEVFARAYFQNLNKCENAGDMSVVFAAAYYVLARVDAAEGRLKPALELVCAALASVPSAVPAQRLYSELTGEEHRRDETVQIGSPLPGGDYDLHQYDPFEIWPDPGPQLSLERATAALDPDGYGLVCVMGRYRSNGPFLDELNRLVALQRGPRAPGFVHVVTEFKGDPQGEYSQYRIQIERDLLRHGLQMQIGYDHSHALTEAVNLNHLPTWYVIGPGGNVRGYGWLESRSVMEAIFKKDPGARPGQVQQGGS